VDPINWSPPTTFNASPKSRLTGIGLLLEYLSL